ncbi:hypothetical protein MSG28_015570 [Choristoneura fumiferana]|uniref:Uncharacterized protein n=1 Tax=Choristoneura fumiferana TaxID=7141 RepID=A0ACC0KAS7_CHOFU|nr:hypothetical protein MSG28_015570 [Choristoneura fumiferana]
MHHHGFQSHLPPATSISFSQNQRQNRRQQRSRSASAEAFGERIDIISDRERGTFRLNDGDLKDAVGRHARRRPDDVFLHSPTPWEDLYRKYNWDQVRTKLRPISTRVLGVRSKPVIVGKKYFENKSSFTAKYNGEVSQQIWKTVSTTTSKGGEITVGQEIEYTVNFGVGSAGGSTSFTFNNNWGESTTKSQTSVLSSGSSISLELQPGQAANAVLTANQGTMEVEVEYEATLSGSVACNYGSPHEGHHFWAYDVNAVLEAAGRPRSIRAKERISIGFYTDEHVTVYDGSGRAIA